MSSNENEQGQDPANEVEQTETPVAEVAPLERVEETSDVVELTADAVESEAPASEAQVEDDNLDVTINYGPMPNVDMTMGSPLRTDDHRPIRPDHDSLSLPSLESSEYLAVTEVYDQREYKPAVTPENVAWARSVQSSASLFQNKDAFTASLARPDSHWLQGLQIGTELFRADRPKYGETGGNRLTGEEARLRIRSAVSAGGRTRVPLWHSGIWVTIKAPTEEALINLESAIAQEKVDLGWRTRGLVFANSSVYITDTLVNFILEHVSDTSYQEKGIESLKEIIKQPDYMQLVWGMLTAIYTDGYVYDQPCMLNPLKCTHVETARLNFGKMSFVDNRAFTDWQREHMRKRNSASMPKLDVERYQSEHRFNRNNVLQIHANIAVELQVPSIAEFVASGRDWVDGIVESVDNAFGRNISAKERNQEIDRRATVTLLQQYAHWIRKITLTAEDRHIEDRETIQEVIADLTSDDETFKNFFDGLKVYIDSIALCVHGIPKYPCPSCQGEPPADVLKHPQVFPIDLVEAFFTLVGQRIQRMLTRRG